MGLSPGLAAFLVPPSTCYLDRKIDNKTPLKTPSISMYLETFHHNQNDHDPFVIIQPIPFITIHLRHIFREKKKKQDAWLQIGQTCRHKLMITNPNKMQNSLHNNRPLHRKCIQTDPSSPKSQAKKRTKTTPLPHRVSPSATPPTLHSTSDIFRYIPVDCYFPNRPHCIHQFQPTPQPTLTLDSTAVASNESCDQFAPRGWKPIFQPWKVMVQNVRQPTQKIARRRFLNYLQVN